MTRVSAEPLGGKVVGFQHDSRSVCAYDIGRPLVHLRTVVNLGRYLTCFYAGHREALAPETAVDDLLQRVSISVYPVFVTSSDSDHGARHIWN